MKLLLTISILFALYMPGMAQSEQVNAAGLDVYRYGGMDIDTPSPWGEIKSGLFYNYNANLFMFKMGIHKKVCHRVNLKLNYIMASQKYALFPGSKSMEFVQLTTGIRI